MEADEIDDGIIVRDYFQDSRSVSAIFPTKESSQESIISILDYEETSRRNRRFRRALVILPMLVSAFIATVIIAAFGLMPMVICAPLVMVLFFSVCTYTCHVGKRSWSIPILVNYRNFIPMGRHLSNIVCEFAHVEPITVVMSRS